MACCTSDQSWIVWEGGSRGNREPTQGLWSPASPGPVYGCLWAWPGAGIAFPPRHLKDFGAERAAPPPGEEALPTGGLQHLSKKDGHSRDIPAPLLLNRGACPSDARKPLLFITPVHRDTICPWEFQACLWQTPSGERAVEGVKPPHTPSTGSAEAAWEWRQFLLRSSRAGSAMAALAPSLGNLWLKD